MQESHLHLDASSPLPWWRFSIRITLIATAATVLLSQPNLVDAIRREIIAPEWLLFGPSLFLLLFLADAICEIFHRETLQLLAKDYIKLFFGLIVIALAFPSSLREYHVRHLPDAENIALIKKYADHHDAGIRALAILASSRQKLNNPSVGALIHQGLLDKDPLVQKAAKLVIEDNFGIRLRNGAEGLHQAQSFISDVDSSALHIRKGSP